MLKPDAAERIGPIAKDIADVFEEHIERFEQSGISAKEAVASLLAAFAFSLGTIMSKTIAPEDREKAITVFGDQIRRFWGMADADA